MKKMDATELVRQLEGKILYLRKQCEEQQELIDRAEEKIDECEHLLSLVKYEEDESVAVSPFIPPRPATDVPARPEYVNEDGSVNFSKVPIDTKVEVRDSDNYPWKTRYFSKFIPNNSNGEYHYLVTERPSKGEVPPYKIGWKQCRLAEDSE
jgi:hypothetical protein